MALRGLIKNGVVVLNPPSSLPEGTEVEVSTVHDESIRKSNQSDKPLADVLANVIGKASGPPTDAAKNHDHYLYGRPKK